MIALTVLDRNIQILCQDTEAHSLLVAHFGYIMTNLGHPREILGSIDLTYTVGQHKQTAIFFIIREGQRPLFAVNSGNFLSLFKKDMSIELQKLRSDLYFIPSAVLEFAGRACILVAASKSGKSMTAWALLHHGFRYLSDELGPLDLKTLEIYPYSHALCLENEPPDVYPLPERTFATSRTVHIPIEALADRTCESPVPLAAIFFMHDCPEATDASVRSVSSAEGGVRLFANALNALAHPGAGLDDVLRIGTKSACFELFTASDLSATCTLVKTTLERVFQAQK